MASSNPYSGVSADVNCAMDELTADQSQYVPQREAEELFRLPDVQIFFISADGRVSTFSEPSMLRIFKFKEKLQAEETNPVFIQVNGWTHPLVSGASPVLESPNGAIMFPDAYAETPGEAVGLVLAYDDVPAEGRSQLLALLQQHTALRLAAEPAADGEERLRPRGRFGRTIVKGAEIVVKGLEYSSEKGAVLIDYVGEQQKSASGAAADPDAKVSPAIKHTASGVKYATHATVKVSGFVAKRVGKLTKGLASYLAAEVAATPSAASGAADSVTDSPKRRMKTSSSLRGLADAALGGLAAYGTIYEGLEVSAKVLGARLKDNSVSVAQHKYGDEAGRVTSDSMTAAGNAAMTYMNVQSLGIKAVAKKTGKETAKQVGKNVLVNASGT